MARSLKTTAEPVAQLRITWLTLGGDGQLHADFSSRISCRRCSSPTPSPISPR
jgi:hypothetical protein